MFFLNAAAFCLERHRVLKKDGRLFSTGHHLFEKDDGLYSGIKWRLKGVKGGTPYSWIPYYYNYNVRARDSPCPVVPNLCSPACFENQPLSRYPRKKHEKRVANAWSICCKAVILHPLSREKRGTVEMLNRDEVLNLTASKKTFFKKNFKKFW